MATNSEWIDAETLSYVFEIKSCRFYNNDSKRERGIMVPMVSKGRFVLQKGHLKKFREKCRKSGKQGIFWFAVYFDEPVSYNLIQCYMKLEDLEKYLIGKKEQRNLQFDKVFREGSEISELQYT